jgi:hypothetical protein
MSMTIDQLALEFTKVLAWPVTAIILLFVYRREINAFLGLLGGSKLTITLFGVEIETTIPELQAITLEAIGGELTPTQRKLLQRMADEEGKTPAGPERVGDDWHDFLRPLRNGGLIKTVPKDSTLGDATDLELTPLGKLLMRRALKGTDRS